MTNENVASQHLAWTDFILETVFYAFLLANILDGNVIRPNINRMKKFEFFLWYQHL
jgi:hypothetical protein